MLVWISAWQELEGKLSLKDEMLSKFQALIEEQSKKILTYEVSLLRLCPIQDRRDFNLHADAQGMSKCEWYSQVAGHDSFKHMCRPVIR